MLCRLHLKECFRKTLLQLLSLVLSGSDAPAAPLSSGGEGKELHCAPPIREPGCSGAPRLALRVNKLYPEILSPPPWSVSHHFFLPPLLSFAFSFFTLWSLFCFYCAIYHCYFSLVSILCPTIPPSTHLLHRCQRKQAVIKCASSPAPLWEGFSHMAVTQSSRAKLCYFSFLSSITIITQLCWEEFTLLILAVFIIAEH